MKIYAKTLAGKCITLSEVGGHRTLYEIKVLLSDAIEIPAEDQRIIFDGKELHDDNATLNDFDVVSESILHIVFRARGMISTFTSKSSSSCCSNDTSSAAAALSHNDKLLIQYLMGKTRRVPFESLQAKAKEEYADKKATFSYSSTGNSILSKAQRLRLVDFMDFMWDATTANTTANSNNLNVSSHGDDDQEIRVDMRLALSDEQFLDLLGSSQVEEVEQQQGDLDTRPKHVLGRLNKAFYSVPGAFGTDRPKIALRQTRGPTRSCINFHCDGPYASSTTQIALSEPGEYKGGTLIFFCNGKVHRLDNRPAGSLVQHPPKVLHGVTCLTSGIRNSLFVVDQQNGLGEEGVIVVTSEHVRSFLESKGTSVAAAAAEAMVAVKRCKRDPAM